MLDSMPVRITGVDFTTSSVFVSFSAGEIAVFDARSLYASRHEEGNQVFRETTEESPWEDDQEQALHYREPYLWDSEHKQAGAGETLQGRSPCH